VKLDKDDLKQVADLWDEYINPACIQFEKETGKPAEALCNAIVAGFERCTKQVQHWNAWQCVWWSRIPEVNDTDLIGELLFCHGHSPWMMAEQDLQSYSASSVPGNMMT
jgi:hypothetical protein